MQPEETIFSFTPGSPVYRRAKKANRRDSLARAVGIKKGEPYPRIIDATAGLGIDAFILAFLGCRVHMIERHAGVFNLLKKALREVYADPEIGGWTQERLTLEKGDSLHALKKTAQRTDVIYLDPMFPEKKKTALSKKEVQYLQDIVAYEADADHLLKLALGLNPRRVVVKRPLHGAFLASLKPFAQIKTKNQRFDLYFPQISN